MTYDESYLYSKVFQLIDNLGLSFICVFTSYLLWGSLSSGLLAGDNSSELGGESASTSAVGDSCLL